MDAPDRVTHAGTYNGNPTTAAAGQATLDRLTAEVLDEMNAVGAEIRQRLARMTEGRPFCVTGAGSLFKLSATPGPIRDYAGALRTDREWEGLGSLALLNAGYLMTPGTGGLRLRPHHA